MMKPARIVFPCLLALSIPVTQAEFGFGQPIPSDAPKLHPPQQALTIQPYDTPFAGLKELFVEAVVEQVLARNPSLAQMTAAWQAASARYPQVTSLEDPMFGAYLGPASIGSNDVDFAYRLEISQKYPFPGKRNLRGQTALAEANAAGNEVEDMRLQLVEGARSAFYDYYLVQRALAVNDESLRLLQDFRKNAENRFKTGLVPQQDVLQADVEIGRQQERQLLLGRMRKVALARINTLMHLPPDAPLPPPPSELKLAEPLPEAQELRQMALDQRPDLQALAHRIDADLAALALARKEFGPDVELMAAYDAFWQPQEKDLRPQIGLRVNLPIRTNRRFAAISEAEAKIAQRRAEFDRLTDQINFDVQQAYEQVLESERTVQLYEKTILPAAQENVKAGLAAYTTAKIPFLSLIEAQRNLVMLRDRYYEAIADYYRRRASLDRLVGVPRAPAANCLPR
jgi:outer membrane protein, heavy metal efflux system